MLRASNARVFFFLRILGRSRTSGTGCCFICAIPGLLEKVTGIVFGDMRQCVAAEEADYLERAILHSLRDFEGPIAIGLRSGHVGGSK